MLTIAAPQATHIETPRPVNLPALTGLRIIAAALVFASHVPKPDGFNPTVMRWMNSGYNGVTLFFVLSGFVLTLNYPTGVDTRRYFVARFARVYPLYLLVLTVSVWDRWRLGQPVHGLWQHILGVQAWSPDVQNAMGINGVAWSVSVELFLYAMFPLLIIPARRVARGSAVAVLTVAVALLAAVTAWFAVFHPELAHRWLYWTPLSRLVDFVAGMMLCRIFTTYTISPTVGRWMWRAGFAVAVWFMFQPWMYLSAWSFDAAYVLPALLIIGGLAVAPPRWMTSRVMVAAGEASFAFYLIHLRILDRVGATTWPGKAAVFVLVLAAAFALHHLVERPARDGIRRLQQLRTARRSTPCHLQPAQQ